MATATATPTRFRDLSDACGVDLDVYRRDHVTSRVERAIEREGVADRAALVRLIRGSQTARLRFRRSVAVPVSGLFRDPPQFELLRRELLPPLLESPRKLRVWSAGCADGSELYTIALLLERVGALEHSFLLGSDVLEENIVAARHGVYDGETMPAALRARARWERRDIVHEAAPGRWNLILCRNVAIYFGPAAKTRLHESLSSALAPAGVLLLGRSERIAEPAALGLETAGRNAYRRCG